MQVLKYRNKILREINSNSLVTERLDHNPNGYSTFWPFSRKEIPLKWSIESFYHLAMHYFYFRFNIYNLQ